MEASSLLLIIILPLLLVVFVYAYYLMKKKWHRISNEKDKEIARMKEEFTMMKDEFTAKKKEDDKLILVLKDCIDAQDELIETLRDGDGGIPVPITNKY